MTREFRLAVAQPPAELATPQGRLNWLTDLLPQVVAERSDLLLLPELFATGYNIGDQVAARAQAVDGATARAIAALAREHDLAIHYGFAEREGDLIFNSAQCIGPDGLRLGGHRKLIIPPGFEAGHFTPGKGCSLFTYRNVRIATLICYDAEFPETARHVASLGAELILVPTALGAQWEWVARCLIPSRAYENGVFLGYANSAGEENGMRFLGQSFIAAPDGQELARAGTRPGVTFGTIHLDKVEAARNRMPYLKDRLMLGPDIR